MKLLRTLDDFPIGLRGGAVAIGNFDGVHQGHARIVSRLRQRAAEVGGPAIVFTFDPHPVRLLRPEQAPPPLTWTDRKAELLAELGIDVMLAYPTDERLLALTPREFFEQLVVERLGARAMVEGPNFYFGRGRAGDVRLLDELCQAAGISLDVVEPLKLDDQYVSSSRIRNAIRQGAVREAAGWLTRPYRIRGMVTHGAARGAKIGFPTANVSAVDTLLPSVGVYAGRAFTERDGVWPTAVNIGPNPTFGEQGVKFEAHLIGFHGSLYGQPIEVEFAERLRDVGPFANVAALQEQLKRDVAETLRIVVH